MVELSGHVVGKAVALKSADIACALPSCSYFPTELWFAVILLLSLWLIDMFASILEPTTLLPRYDDILVARICLWPTRGWSMTREFKYPGGCPQKLAVF